MCPDSAARARRTTTANPRKSKNPYMNVEIDEVLSALQKARGRGLTLKQLAGQLHAGRDEVRRTAGRLVKEGRVIFDGNIYRASGKPAAEAPERKHTEPRRAPAA